MAASDKSVAVSTNFSFDSSISDGWQELTKSDYAKVIFSDILCNAASGTLECKLQITDNVHEDPNDYVGLFRVGFDDLSQCLVSKMLSQTKCEDDGKLQRCVFMANELPSFDDGFYQFLYVTRDQEICGASMPFKINMSPFQLEERSVEVSTAEKMDGDFLLVNEEMERKIKGEIDKQEKTPVQQNAFSEQKKEEIAAWVSQSPGCFSLIEQTEEQTPAIQALQLSKDIAMKEIVHLREIVNSQNGEINQLKNMLAAYEEKIKISFDLHEQKTNEVMQLTSLYEGQMVKERCLREQKNTELNELKKSFVACEEKLKMYEHLQDELQTEIADLKKKQKTKSFEDQVEDIEDVIDAAKDFVGKASRTIKNLDFTDVYQVEKFFYLKTQLLILWSRMKRATDVARLCDQDGLHNGIHSVIEKEMKGNSYIGTSCALETIDSALTKATANVVEGENKDMSEKDVERIPFKKSLELGILELQNFQLPRLEVITNKDKALTSELGLNAQDIFVINRLTEKIMKNSFNVYELFELVDDSSSDSGSDTSDISDCTSTKKDLVCVDKVIETLLFCNETSLEQMVVVEDEEDENLKCRHKWNVLLKKCAVNYQIAILLEHIEKQKEGIKKVSDKICELLTKCMLLKDEVSDSKAVCEQLQLDIAKKDKDISELKGELELQNSLLCLVSSEKEELEGRVELAEQTVEDFHDRILEASDLYKRQYTEIGKLSKKLQKYKSAKDTTKDCKRETSVSSENSGTTSSFEVVQTKSVQKVNDSDTGEHMFEKASIVKNEKLNTSGPGVLYLKPVKNKSDRFISALDVSKRNVSGASKKDKEKLNTNVSANSRLSMNGLVFVDEKLQFEKNLLATIIQQLEKKNCIAPKYLRILKENCNKIQEPMAFSACLRNVADALKLPAKSSVNKQKSQSLINKNKTLEQELRMLKQNLESYQIKIKEKDVELKEAYKSLETIQAQIDANNEVKEISKSCSDLCLNPVDDLLSSIHELKIEDSGASTTTVNETAENKSFQTATVFSDFASYGQFQEIIKEQFTNITKPPASRNSQECSISCYFCKSLFPLGPEDPSDLMIHLENKHSIKVCPVCGQLFEEEIPPRYFHIHVEQHFETE